MDLLFLTGISIFFGIILISMGLAFLDQSLSSLNYNNDYGAWNGLSSADYYNNPLAKINSKWFHYRPKGSVILSKKQWADIEANIEIKIKKAKEAGKILGRKAVIIEIQDRVKEEQTKIVPSNPYEILGVKAKTSALPSKLEMENNYKHLRTVYNPENFTHLDKSFVELAEIRIEQITEAWRKVKMGIIS